MGQRNTRGKYSYRLRTVWTKVKWYRDTLSVIVTDMQTTDLTRKKEKKKVPATETDWG